MSRKIILPLSMALALTGLSQAAEPPANFDLSKVDFSKASRISVGTGGVLDSLDNAGAVPSEEKMKSYGFTTNIAPEKGSFRLGVLLADLQVAANGGDKARTLATAQALLNGVVALEAPHALTISVTQLVAAIQHGTEPKAVAQLARPLLYPAFKEFIEKQGHLQSFFMGEWAETVYLAASAISDGKSGSLALGERGAALAQELPQGSPAGASEALKAIASASKVEKPDPRAARAVISAIEELKALLG